MCLRHFAFLSFAILLRRRHALRFYMLVGALFSSCTLLGLSPCRAQTPARLTGTVLPAQCDVIVVGATPSGIAAALAAARRGAKVLLIEEREAAGGDIVFAMLNMFDVVARPGQASPAHGIFAEFFERLGLAYDIETAHHLFQTTLREQPNLQFLPRTKVVTVLKNGNRVVALQLKTAQIVQRVDCRVVIDATDDAQIATRAGAGFSLGREASGIDKRMQSAGLLFSLRGVDWKRVRSYVRGRRLVQGTRKAAHSATVKNRDSRSQAQWLRLGGAQGNYAWERGDIIKGYRPKGGDIELLSINFGRQNDDSVVLNTLNIVGVNGLSSASKNAARAQAIRELPYLLPYLRARMPGLERATLGRIAPELYIRETRHIHGLATLQVTDIRSQRQFFDRVARVSYPLDLHPYFKGDRNPFGPQRYLYTIPLRALVPRDVDGIFVASRSLSATYAAAGSARVIPVTMACGEAVGAAAWLCNVSQSSPHSMTKDNALIKRLQQSLRQFGADIGAQAGEAAAGEKAVATSSASTWRNFNL